MYNKDKNIVGIGCDFQSENDDNSSRKLAIENLSGGEKEKIKWMVKNMISNKAFIFKSKGKSKIEKEKILKEFQDRYIKSAPIATGFKNTHNTNLYKIKE